MNFKEELISLILDSGIDGVIQFVNLMSEDMIKDIVLKINSEIKNMSAKEVSMKLQNSNVSFLKMMGVKISEMPEYKYMKIREKIIKMAEKI